MVKGPSAILMFHGIDREGSVLSVSPEQFSSLINAIDASGYQIVELQDLLRNPGTGRVALTFDDGFSSVLNEAAPILDGRPATLFVTTGVVGKFNSWESDAYRRSILSWHDLAKLESRGFKLECHTVNHPDLRGLSDADVEAQFEESKEELHQQLGAKATVLAYPYGYVDRRVADIAASHFEYAVSTQFSALRQDQDQDRMLMPRLDAYYLRAPAAHRGFGRPAFWAYVGSRGLLRRLKGHPGESVPRP